ncbi:MAG: type II CAAX endopeptidase family protein [Ilumatobacteraceae bacterium]
MGEMVDYEPVRPIEPGNRRRAIVVAFGFIGVAGLAWGLRTDPGSGAFYASTFVLAVVWLIGGLLAGPVPLGWEAHDDGRRRPVLSAVIAGTALAAVFVAGALVVKQIPALSDRVEGVVQYADEGSWPIVLLLTVANGMAEEVFFRGAVQPALPKRFQLPGTVLIYAAMTMATGNVMLGFAAVILGALVGLQRRATGGVLAPILTHVTWSVSMFVALPIVFR